MGLERYSTPREKLLGVFELMGELFKDQKYRGCAFIRASAEVKAGSSIKTVCDDSRAWLRDLFQRLAKDAASNKPARLADQLMLLYDGASVAAQMDRSGTAATSARVDGRSSARCRDVIAEPAADPCDGSRCRCDSRRVRMSRRISSARNNTGSGGPAGSWMPSRLSSGRLGRWSLMKRATELIVVLPGRLPEQIAELETGSRIALEPVLLRVIWGE